MGKVDEHAARKDTGEKLYKVDGLEYLQVLGFGFRLVKIENGYRLQKQYKGEPRGDMTQIIWADIPIVDQDGNFIGYDLVTK